jgi:nucleoside phosphorylase
MRPLRSVILTALPEEYEAVKNHLENVIEHTHDQGTVYQIGNFVASSDSTWGICLAEIGAGNASAAQETERAISFFKPTVAMFVGVAGGLKDVSIGDVVVATKVYAYESGKAEDTFQARPEVRDSAYNLVQRARAESKRKEWTRRIAGFESISTSVRIGAIASGEKLVASRNSAFYTFLREHYGDALAVEMEGRGFLEATRSHPEVSAVIVRGISDLIDGKSEADAGGSQALAARNASAFAFQLLANYRPLGSAGADRAGTNQFKFEQNLDAEHLIKDIKLGDWDASADAAIQLIQNTSPDGVNSTFEALLKYYDCPDEDLKWAAFQTVESAVGMAPDLIDRKTLAHFSTHPDFSVRAHVASILMDLSNFAPARVPVDILIRLSIYSEDWYVQAPANAALKTLARSMPQILRIFINRLHSRDPLEREHAAAALADVARNEPELLDYEEMCQEIIALRRLKDKNALSQLMAVLPEIRKASGRQRYRYGL